VTIREIRLFGDPVLKTKSDEIKVFDQSIHSLVSDLIDTTSMPGRAGVAAPQIGVNLRAFSYNVNGEIGYLLNPVITELAGDKVLVEEGCLSVPGLWHKTPRFERATVEGFDLAGNKQSLSGTGLLAQAIQHECDHLDGFLYLDRLDPDERKVAMKLLRESDWFLKN
jgi:peptide deformylase